MSRPDDQRDASAAATYYLDCERMRHPLTGVYEFCRRLGSAISRRLESGERIVRYGPELPEGTFPESVGTLRQHSYHKFTRIRPKDATLWHGCYQRTQYLPSRKIPFVLTIHDLNFLHEGKSSNSLRRNIQRVQKNVDRAAAVVVISEFVAEDVRRHLKVDASRLHVVHNGCERIDLADRTRPASVPERDFVFALGPTNAKKNFHVLPALLVGNDFELVIAGFSEEPYAGRILNHAAALGVSDRVRIVGPVSESEKAWYYANCSAFAFPSLAEGFGLPVVEAMLFGKRVFLSKSTSLPEIGGSHATYFDSFEPEHMKDVFSAVMSSPLSEDRAEAIRARARGFSWEKAAAGYLEIYRNCARDRAAL